MVRIHTQTELHTAGVVELVGILEEEMRTFRLDELERLYLIELVIIMGRGADGYELHADALIIEAVGIELYLYLNLVAYIEVVQVV